MFQISCDSRVTKDKATSLLNAQRPKAATWDLLVSSLARHGPDQGVGVKGEGDGWEIEGADSADSFD